MFLEFHTISNVGDAEHFNNVFNNIVMSHSLWPKLSTDIDYGKKNNLFFSSIQTEKQIYPE